jgi:Dihaem cytochrome c
MSSIVKRQSRNKKLKRKPLGFLLVILAWSLAMGWLLALASNVQGATPTSEIGTVDIVPKRYQLGQELYLENCSTCHIALPPEVFPTQTWKNILQDTEHYGTQLKPLIDPPRMLVWNYLSTFSRTQLKDEQTPYRLSSSRYFKALHPKVDLPTSVQIDSCITCHPSAKDFNFRRLSREWE